MISAKIILDSVNTNHNRLTTFEVTFHRFLLPEFNTHRVFARNSASSRAIPFRKTSQRVKDNPAIPHSFPLEQPGMSGGNELPRRKREAAERRWIKASKSANRHAKKLAKLGVHKSVVNRLIEPFSWHTVIVTATEWDGFWQQRCHEAAQPEFRVLALQMMELYDNSTPTLLQPGEWHLPLIQPDEVDFPLEIKQKLSTARCARVSYLTHDGIRDIDKDIDLFNKLVVREIGNHNPIHWSPLEHVATPKLEDTLGCFVGWEQFRHTYDKG